MGRYRINKNKQGNNNKGKCKMKTICANLPQIVVKIMDKCVKLGFFPSRSEMIRCYLTPWALDMYELMAEKDIDQFQPSEVFLIEAERQRLIPQRRS